MNTKSRPKQFLELHGKPILAYTMEIFERSPEIDAIVLVSLSDWIAYCHDLTKRYGFSKVVAIVPGGSVPMESILAGLRKVSELFPKESIVLIHDGVRPLIHEELIRGLISDVRTYGNAVTVSPAIETVLIAENGEYVGKILNRTQCLMARAPQCFVLGDIMSAFSSHEEKELFNFIDCASMMQFYGVRLHPVVGPSTNIKITTPIDYYMFRAVLDARETSQILGLE